MAVGALRSMLIGAFGVLLAASTACATRATLVASMPRSRQYEEESQAASGLARLLALHPQQHKAMFASLMSDTSLTMCSQEGHRALGPTGNSNMWLQ